LLALTAGLRAATIIPRTPGHLWHWSCTRIRYTAER